MGGVSHEPHFLLQLALALYRQMACSPLLALKTGNNAGAQGSGKFLYKALTETP